MGFRSEPVTAALGGLGREEMWSCRWRRGHRPSPCHCLLHFAGLLVRGKAPKEQEVHGRAEVVPAKLLIIFNGRSVPQP